MPATVRVGLLVVLDIPLPGRPLPERLRGWFLTVMAARGRFGWMNKLELDLVLRRHLDWLDTDERHGKRANFSGENLKGVDFSGKRLDGAVFAGANLENASFENAQVRRADFGGARMVGADLESVGGFMANFSEADLRNADLSWANLQQANLSKANLRKADLYRTHLQKAILVGASLPEVMVHVGEVCFFNSFPYILLKEEEDKLVLLGADGKLTPVPYWYKWTNLKPSKG